LRVDSSVPLVDLARHATRAHTYRGRTFTPASATARSIGFAHLVARTKVTLYSEDGAGLAAAVDVRLPTGRQEDLLGAGQTSMKLSAIGSLESGKLSTHV